MNTEKHVKNNIPTQGRNKAVSQSERAPETAAFPNSLSALSYF